MHKPWDYHLDVGDIGIDTTYLYKMQRRHFPHFTRLDALLVEEKQGEDVGDSGRRGDRSRLGVVLDLLG